MQPKAYVAGTGMTVFGKSERSLIDLIIEAAEKALKDGGDKVPEDVKKKVEEKIESVKNVLKDADPDKEKLENATKELSEELQQVGASMYKQDEKGQETKDKDDDGKKDEEVKKDDGKVEEGEVVEEK